MESSLHAKEHSCTASERVLCLFRWLRNLFRNYWHLFFASFLGTGEARQNGYLFLHDGTASLIVDIQIISFFKEVVKPDDTFNMSQAEKLNTQVPCRPFVSAEISSQKHQSPRSPCLEKLSSHTAMHYPLQSTALSWRCSYICHV